MAKFVLVDFDGSLHALFVPVSFLTFRAFSPSIESEK